MEELRFKQPELVGRAEELGKLKHALSEAIEGKGSTIFISGEAGIGKTRLVSELIKEAKSRDSVIIQGWCLAESLEPLMPVKSALRDAGMQYLISGRPPPLVVSAYLMNDAGLLIAKAEREETDMDSDIFASMLQAVRYFVRDSLSMIGEKGGALNSLGYDKYKILIETRGKISLVTTIEGSENEFLIEDMRRTLRDIGGKLDEWSGDESEVSEIEPKISWFVDSGKYEGRFLVDDPKIKQENLFDNILLGIQRESEERPVLIFLDDLQWSDPSTLNLVHYLSRNTRKHRVLILGTYRPEDIVEDYEGKTHPLETAMQNMRREDLLERIELKRLDVNSTVEIVNSMLGSAELDQEFREKIYDDTAGSPFFTMEVIKMLVEDGTISRDDEGVWHLEKELHELDIPPRVYDVVKKRLNRLTKEQRQILECASVMGDKFESTIIGSILGLNRIRLLRNLSEIEKTHHLVHYLQGAYRFDHAKIREVLYNGIGVELRREYHRIIGETIEDMHRENLDEVVSELAYHYYEAGDRRAGGYLIKAGGKAAEKYANEEAIRLFKQALKFADGREKLAILEKLGDIRSVIGEYERAIENFERAIEAADDNETKARNLRKIGDAYEKKGEYEKALGFLDAAKGLVEESSLEMGRVLETEGAVYLGKGDYEKSLSLFQTALKLFEKYGAGKRDMGNALRVVGIIHWSKGEYDQALGYYEKSLELMQKISEQYGISAALNNIGIVYYDKGNLDSALDYYERSLKIIENIGNKYGIARALNNIGLVHIERGDLEKALEYLERSLEMREEIGDKSGNVVSLEAIGEIYLYKGKLEEALNYLMRSFKICSESGARTLSIYVLCDLAEVKLEMGDVQSSLENAEKAVEIAVKIVARAEEGMSHRVLGKVYREMKEWKKAMEEFEKAIKILRGMGDKREAARVFYEYGLMWKAKGEYDKAHEHLKKALSMFEEMSMKLWAERSRKALGNMEGERGKI